MEWMPEVSGLLPAAVLHDICTFSRKASCRRLEELPAVAAAGFTDLCVTRPGSDLNDLQQIMNRVRHCDLTFVADHFRQAELLSQAACEVDCSVSVLIDTECGRQLTGVRPGPDSVRLAEAISQLPRLTVGGVFVDDEAVTILGSAASGTVTDILISSDPEIIAIHSRRMIQAAGISCPRLVSGRFFNPVSRPSTAVTHCLLSPLERAAGIECRQVPDGMAANASRLAPWTVFTRVLSRPTLETCVIDAGTSLLGADTIVLSPPGATLLRSAADVSALSLSGAALDLRIGDLVELETASYAGFHLPVMRLDTLE